MDMKLHHRASRLGRLLPWLLAGWLAAGGFAASLAAPGIDIRRDATVEAVEKVLPSVVNIATKTIVRVHDPFEEMYRRLLGQPNSYISLGSGVIIDEEGYLLTNDHVVRRADQIAVKFCTSTNV